MSTEISWHGSRPSTKTAERSWPRQTQAQLAGVLWGEITAAHKSAADHGRPLGGKFSGLTWDLGATWKVEAYGSGSIESKSGRHAGDLLVVVDEASGVEASVHEAIDSLNPSRRLYTGNPIRPEGKFYELCELSKDNPNVNVIEISSLESPHVHLARSPWGMADATFIENAKHEYGEESLWFQVHVLGKFPGELDQGAASDILAQHCKPDHPCPRRTGPLGGGRSQGARRGPFVDRSKGR